MKRFLFFVVSIMLFSSLFSFAFIETASAHGVATSHSTQSSKHTIPNTYPTNCVGNGEVVIWTSDGANCYTQTGVLQLTLYNVDYLYAGNWSGYLTFSNGNMTKFCDNESTFISGTVIELFIAPSRLSGC